MSSTLPGTYTFLPWVREGLTAAGLPRDTLMANVPARVALPVELRVNQRDVVRMQARLHGPGDVIGIDRRQVVRTEPRHLTRNFEPNFLAAIEFDRPDFPWLFTPAAADAQNRVRPWLGLVVVEKQDGVRIVTDRDRPLPVLEIRSPAHPAAELPDLGESWGWAHAQVAGSLTTGPSLDQVLASHPERTVGRLICPRRLEPSRSYLACVVPTFDVGRKAGLGLPVTDADAATLQPAWQGTPATLDLPIYYHWEFATGPDGDFQSLVEQLKARKMPDTVGIRALDVSAADPGLPPIPPGSPDAVLGLEGALMADTTKPKGWTNGIGATFRAALRRRLGVADPSAVEPAVTPPIYGARHANQSSVPADGVPPHWLRELNLDPRYRAVTAFGTQVVQAQQEELMASAWEQAGEIERANRILRQAQLMREATQAVYRLHLSRLAESPLLQVTRAAHAQVLVAAGSTLQSTIGASNTPPTVTAGAFRRVARPRGAITRRVLPVEARRVRPIVQMVAMGSFTFTPLPRPPGGLVTLESVEARFKATGGVRAAGVDVSFARLSSADIAAIPPRPAFALRTPEVFLPVPLGGVFQPIGTGTVFEATAAATRARPVDAEPGEPVEPVSPTGPVVGPVIGPIVKPPVARDNAQAGLFRAALLAHQPPIRPIMVFVVARAPLQVATLKTTVLARLDPAITIPSLVRPLIAFRGPQPAGDELAPIMAAPVFPRPMYEALRDLSQDLLVPGIDVVPDNTVAMLVTNQRFVEAFMVGLNHEMARELLWRGYPTDQRGSYFRQFWDASGQGATLASASGTGDIPPIHAWAPVRALGQNATGGAAGRVVLLVRGQLLRRHPTAVIYAVEGVPAVPGQAEPGLGTRELYPMFRGSLEPDLVFFGFNLGVDQARGGPSTPGWFFVIQQQPTEPRFGLDVGATAPPGPFLHPTGGNAAATARGLMQRPVRIAIHAKNMLA